MNEANTLLLEDAADTHPVDESWEELRIRDRTEAIRRAAAEIGKQMGGGNV